MGADSRTTAPGPRTGRRDAKACAEWQLDARLAGDTHSLARLPLCDLRLMDERRWCWLVLVPRIPAARELVDLDEAAHAALTAEIRRCSQLLLEAAGADKLNVAALGNVVEQLHVHLIARRRDDPAWPRPVWGAGEREPRSGDERDALINLLAARLGA